MHGISQSSDTGFLWNCPVCQVGTNVATLDLTHVEACKEESQNEALFVEC